jgi:hypothetical protein
LALFLVGFLNPPEEEGPRRLQRYLLLMLLLAAILLSATSQRFDRLLTFVPSLTVFAAASVVRLVRSARAEDLALPPPLWPQVAVWTLAALPLLCDLVSPRAAASLPPSRNVGMIAANTGKDQAVMTDAPWTIAWHGKRNAVWLAQTPEDLTRIEERVGRLPWIYFSRQRDLLDQDAIAPWWVEATGSFQGYRAFLPAQSLDGKEVVLKRSFREG